MCGAQGQAEVLLFNGSLGPLRPALPSQVPQPQLTPLGIEGSGGQALRTQHVTQAPTHVGTAKQEGVMGV